MTPEFTELLTHSTHPLTTSLRNNEPLYLSYVVPEARESNDADYSIVHFISTETVDRYGDIVHADGMEDDNFRKNPVVFYGHASWGFPVGKSLWRKVATRNGIKGVLAKTQFAKTEEGLLCYQLWKEGFLNASSIGFLPIEWEPIVVDDPGITMGKRVTGYEFRRWELLEYSIVGVPANPDAVRQLLQKDFVKSPRFRKALEVQLMEMEREITGATSNSHIALNQLNKERLAQAKTLLEQVLTSEEKETDVAKNNETEHPAQPAETLVEEVDLMALRETIVKSTVDGKVSELTGRFRTLSGH